MKPSATTLADAVVLVVDDDPFVLSAVARVLTNAGARVYTAGGGDQAIAIATSTAIGVLLTDVDMPGRDGLAVASAVRQIRPRVGVVFMSGRPREAHVARGQLTEDAVLVGKPFAQDVLVQTLVGALAASRG